jgi:hypothetical protein
MAIRTRLTGALGISAPIFSAPIAEVGIYAGEAVGLIHESLPAAEVLSQVVAEAETLLRERAQSFVC